MINTVEIEAAPHEHLRACPDTFTQPWCSTLISSYLSNYPVLVSPVTITWERGNLALQNVAIANGLGIYLPVIAR